MNKLKLEKGFNSGLLYEPKPEDYVLGGITGITYEIRLPDGDWSKYFPRGERQKFRNLETMACASYTANDSFETQVNWMLKEDLIDGTLIQDWIDENGDFNLSDRFTAKMSGTNPDRGNSLNAPAESLRKNGCPPEKLWPANDDFIQSEYYKSIPQSVKDTAKRLLDYFDVKYEWLTATYDTIGKKLGYQAVKRDSIVKELKQAPINFGTAVCPGWFSDEVVQACSLGANHATLNGQFFDSGHIAGSFFKQLDHYEPFVKKLSSLYVIYFGLKMVVTPKDIIKKKNMDATMFLKTHDLKFVRNADSGAFGRILQGKLKVVNTDDRGVLLLLDDKVRNGGVNIPGELWDSLEKENF